MKAGTDNVKKNKYISYCLLNMVINWLNIIYSVWLTLNEFSLVQCNWRKIVILTNASTKTRSNQNQRYEQNPNRILFALSSIQHQRILVKFQALDPNRNSTLHYNLQFQGQRRGKWCDNAFTFVCVCAFLPPFFGRTRHQI